MESSCTCPSCGKIVQQQALFCPNCGASIAPGSPVASNGPSAIPQPSADVVEKAAQNVSATQNAAGEAMPIETWPPQAQQPMQAPVIDQTRVAQAPQPYPYAPAQPTGQFGASSAPAPIDKYKTLGGWLLVFVILNIIDALSGFGQLVQSLSAGMGPNVFFVLVMLVEIAFDVVFVVFIVGRNVNVLRLFQAGKVIIGVLQAIMNLTAIPEAMYYGSRAMLGGIIAQTAGTLVGAGVGLVLLTMYFCKSVRVRTYMGSTEYQDRAFFRIGV